MERWQIEQKDMNDGRCKSCPKCRGVSAGSWSFYGCYHAPYKGKWVAEIEKCPKGRKEPDDSFQHSAERL